MAGNKYMFWNRPDAFVAVFVQYPLTSFRENRLSGVALGDMCVPNTGVQVWYPETPS